MKGEPLRVPPFAFYQGSYFYLYSCFLFPYLHQKKLPPKIPSYLPPRKEGYV